MRVPKNFLSALLTLSLALSLSDGVLATTLPATHASYSTSVGKFKVVALYDGYLPADMIKILEGGDGKRVIKLIEQAGLEKDARMSVNVYLVDTGDKKILMDTGGGVLTGSTAGRLKKSLKSAGYSPDQIDVILLTHLHADHIGGLLNERQERAFKNAIVEVNELELSYWLSAPSVALGKEDKPEAFAAVKKYLKPYQDAGRIRTFQWGEKLFSGIEAVDLRGHTPGHTGFKVSDSGEQLLFWGDVIHVEPVQFPEPEVTVIYDSSPKQAISTRKAALEDATMMGYKVADSHIDFPGIGKVGKRGDDYIWVPIKK
ncbi:MBL fold metallo-hydrolase [Pseudomonas aeruginosa]